MAGKRWRNFPDPWFNFVESRRNDGESRRKSGEIFAPETQRLYETVVPCILGAVGYCVILYLYKKNNVLKIF